MGAPNYSDGSYAIELSSRQYGWGKFFTLERDKGPTIPWDPSLSSGVMMKGAPTSANLQAQGRVHAFVRGTDNSIWSKGQDGTWWEWYSLGAPPGNALGEPAAVTTAGTTGMYVGVLNASGVYLKQWNGSWGSWSSFGSPPATLGSYDRLTMTSWGSSRLDVFVADASGNIWQKTTSPQGKYDWRNLGSARVRRWRWRLGAPMQEPDFPFTARIDLFVKGTDHHLWHKACQTLADCTQ